MELLTKKGVAMRETENQTVVVFDEQTKEIIACFPIQGGKAILKNGGDFKIYNGTEPIFTDTGTRVVLNESVFIWNGG